MSIEKVENTKEKKLWFESVMGNMWGNKNANPLKTVPVRISEPDLHVQWIKAFFCWRKKSAFSVASPLSKLRVDSTKKALPTAMLLSE